MDPAIEAEPRHETAGRPADVAEEAEIRHRSAWR